MGSVSILSVMALTSSPRHIPDDPASLTENIGTILYNYIQASRTWGFDTAATALNLPKMSGQTLSLHLRGKNGGLGLEEAMKLCSVLGLEFDDVLDGARGNGPLALLLSTQLHLVATNDEPEQTGLRRRSQLRLVRSQ